VTLLSVIPQLGSAALPGGIHIARRDPSSVSIQRIASAPVASALVVIVVIVTAAAGPEAWLDRRSGR
jgi:hypothetical protein